jgi:hypothetical protein
VPRKIGPLVIAPMQPASDLHYRSICVTKALKAQPKNAG